jgi:hypothetical protein
MGNAGLLLVGVVLLVNGLVILNVVPPKSASLLNIFVGAAQVVLPTIVLIQNAADPLVVNATWPTYLFGITYLYYGIGILIGAEPEGLGWFSAFVAAVVGYLAVTTIGTDPVFAVMLGTWAIMWSLFFLLMAGGIDSLGRFTGWFLVLLGVPSCTVTGIALLQGRWTTSAAAGWLALAGLGVGIAASTALARSRWVRSGTAAAAKERRAQVGSVVSAAEPAAV